MSKILIATIPAIGHVTPLIAITEELIAQGHEVEWYTGKFFQERVEKFAKFRPICSSPDYASLDEVPQAIIEERESLKGIKQIKYDLNNFFVKPSTGYYKDLSIILDEFKADVIVSDSFFIAASWISETYDIPWVQVSISVLAFDGIDVAPFGLGLQPDSSFLGKWRNKALNKLSNLLIFKEILELTNSERAKLGLKRTKISFQNVISPDLYISGSIAEFEYRRSDLPSQVHFVGPLFPSVVTEYEVPEWWDELSSNDKRVIVVTQGTVATNLEDLLLPTIHALQNEDFFIVGTTGGQDPKEMHLGDLPNNVKIEKFVPFYLLFPYVDLFITNGGFNGVMMALSHGIPLVVAGKTEDKAEVSARVQYSGTGINLKTSQPKPHQIKNAVSNIFKSKTYRSNAMELSKKIKENNSAQCAAKLIESLVQRSAEQID